MIPTSSAGSSTQIRFSAILSLMQDAAYAHAAALGVGYDELMKIHRAFFLSRMEVSVLSTLPSWGERIVLQTWPSGVERLLAHREFELSREGREPFLRAATSWLMIDTEARRPIRPQEHFIHITPREV
ncbi:MAG TPA: thioesterase, partial [Opitutales bacterium]|nr:thioesterase [Opitutales bacterium]